jgi:hypothetical protein
MKHARTRRRASAAVVAAVVVLLLGGCGIQETDVIEAGDPAGTEAFFNRNDNTLLFFRFPDGVVTPVIRQIEPPANSGNAGAKKPGAAARRMSAEKAVLALLRGPRAKDRAAGLTTALPAARPGATVEIEPAPNNGVTVRLPLDLKELDSTALRQLTCTIAYSLSAAGQTVVELTGQDGTSSTGTCGLASGSTGNAGL